MVIALVTGGFDPLHIGHIRLFQEAAKFGNLVVGLNSDKWLINKKGTNFLPLQDRRAIIEEIKGVKRVLEFDDSDGTAIDAIRRTIELYPNHKIVFCNGGDRTNTNIPEYYFCIENNVELKFEVGGGKANSSSWLLSNWTSNNKETRPWGTFQTVATDGNIAKVKKLTIESGKSISLQRHKHRTEYWVVVEGVAFVMIDDYNYSIGVGESIQVRPGQWHTVRNNADTPLRIIEIQHGTSCTETDIERRME